MDFERNQTRHVLRATLNRRRFLTLTGAAVSLAFTTRLPGANVALAQRPFSSYPFTLGIASGDPLPDSVVLWTRLAPDPFDPTGGLRDKKFPVEWKVATDEGFANVIREGTAFARPEFAHSVHVDVQGLEPGREYYYQFKAGPELSSVGRTKTAPAAGAAIDRYAFAFASCQNYPAGYYTAYRDMAEQGLDLIVHLGDYIYEGPQQGALGRGHLPAHETFSLDDYRIRLAQYKTDPDLQTAHARFPWLVTWDDHEVDNNYSARDADPDMALEEFLARRANAYRAYWEHMPLRELRLPQGPDMPLYRRFTFGNMVEFNVLDTRQYRDDQTNCAGEVMVDGYCASATDPDRTILGGEQEQWLLDGLDRSSARWNVLAQQVLFAQKDNAPVLDRENYVGGGDQWDGYKADRDSILNFIQQRRPANPIVITGDWHRNAVYDLKADFADPQSETLGVEFVGTSISSAGDPVNPVTTYSDPDDPHERFYNTNRGYVRCELTAQLWRSDFRVVHTVTAPTSPASTLASFVVEDGKPGAQQA